MRLAVLLFAALLSSCSSSNADDGACTPGGDGRFVDAPYDKLADYCLLTVEGGRIVPKAGVVPYEVKNPLFSDYALKARSVLLPKGTKAQLRGDGPFELPVGSILVKSFGYPADTATPTPTAIAADGPPMPVRWIETRLLVRAGDGWRAYTYVWDDAQKEAVLRPGGSILEAPFTDAAGQPKRATYLVPSQNQCKKCHEDGGALVPIGLRPEQIDVGQWSRDGLLEGAPSNATTLPVWSDPKAGTVEERARAYLATNCAYCHVETGSARTSGLLLGRKVTDPYVLGVCKTPVAAGKAAADMQYDIVPGQPDKSILLYRMRATEPQVAMPEIGRSLPHGEAIGLLSEWIAGMTGSCTK